MAQLLIRDLPETTKRKLQKRAIDNGRTQNEEAILILEKALEQGGDSWLRNMREAALAAGGIDIDLPERSAARPFSFEED